MSAMGHIALLSPTLTPCEAAVCQLFTKTGEPDLEWKHKLHP